MVVVHGANMWELGGQSMKASCTSFCRWRSAMNRQRDIGGGSRVSSSPDPKLRVCTGPRRFPSRTSAEPVSGGHTPSSDDEPAAASRPRTDNLVTDAGLVDAFGGAARPGRPAVDEDEMGGAGHVEEGIRPFVEGGGGVDSRGKDGFSPRRSVVRFQMRNPI
jgi:hypothetical protein